MTVKYVFDEARQAFLRTHWDAMKITREADEMEKEARAIIGHKLLYQIAADATGVPWWLIGVIDAREGGIQHLGHRHLHNGDALSGYTYHEPKGRPRVGHGPPFSWTESAVDALRYQGFDIIRNWTIERALHSLEPYNGLGYFMGPVDIFGRKHQPMPSPYIWSCTNQYDPPGGPGGKYVADHKFDPRVVDEQIGCAPLIAMMAGLDPTIDLQNEIVDV